MDDQSMKVQTPTEFHEDERTSEQPQLPQQSNTSRKKRLLSVKQLEALERGREVRMSNISKKKSASFNPPEIEELPSSEDSSEGEGVTVRQPELSSESSTDEDIRVASKAKKLKKSIPRVIRKKLDKYIQYHLEKSKKVVPSTPTPHIERREEQVEEQEPVDYSDYMRYTQPVIQPLFF